MARRGDDSLAYGLLFIGLALVWIGKNLFSRPLESVEAMRRNPLSQRTPEWARSSAALNKVMLKPLGAVLVVVGGLLMLGGAYWIWAI